MMSFLKKLIFMASLMMALPLSQAFADAPFDPGSGSVSFTHFTATVTFNNSNDLANANPAGTKYLVRIRDSANAIVVSSETYAVQGISNELLSVRVKGLTAGTAYTATAQAINPANIPNDTGAPNSQEVVIAAFTTTAITLFTYHYDSVTENSSILRADFDGDFILWKGVVCGYDPTSGASGCGLGGVDYTFGPLPNGNRFVQMYNPGGPNRIKSSQIILVESDQFGESKPLPLDPALTKIDYTPHTPETNPGVTALSATATTIQGQWWDSSVPSAANASWTTYRLEACTHADFSGTCVSSDVAKSGNNEIGTLNGLSSDTTYYVRVKALNYLLNSPTPGPNAAVLSDSAWFSLGTIKTLFATQDPGSGFVEFTHFTATVTFHNSSDPVNANPAGTKYVVRIRDSANSVVVSSETYAVSGVSNELLHVRVKGLTPGTAYTATSQAINPANVPTDTGALNSKEVVIGAFTTLALNYTYQYTTIDEHHSVLHMEFPADIQLWRGRGCGYTLNGLAGCGTGGVDFTFGPLPNGNKFVDMYNFASPNRMISSQIILVENDQFGDSGPLPLDNNLTKIALTPHTPEKDPSVTALTVTATTIQGQWLDTTFSSATNATWTTYHLEACVNADFSGTCVSSDVAKNSGNSETATIGGLQANTTYSVRVKANNILSNVTPMSDSDWLVLGTIKTLPIIQDPGPGFVEFTHFTATVTFHNSSDPVKANPVGTKYVVRIRNSANAVVVSSDTYSVLGTSSEFLHVRVKGLTAGTAYTATAQAINPSNIPTDTGAPNSNEVLIASFTTLALTYTYQYTTIDEHHSVLHMEFPSDIILWRGRGCGYSPTALFGCGTGGVDYTFGPLPNGNRFVDMYNFGAGNRIISSQIILVENDQFGDSGPLPLDNNLTKIALTPHTPEKDPSVTALTVTPTTIQGQWLDTSFSSATNASWTMYHLEACQNADFSGTCVSTDVAKNSGTAETGTVGGLLPSTTYSVRVKAKNILSNVAPMSDSDWLVLGTIKTLPIIQDPGPGFVEFTHFTATVTFHNSSDPVKANPVGTTYLVRIRNSASAVVVSSETYSVLGTSSELLHVRVKGLTAGTAYTATAQAINPANVPTDTGAPNSNEVLIASFTTLSLTYTYHYTTIDERHSVLHMEFPSDFILWRGRGCGYSPAALFGCGTGGVDFTFGPLPNGNRFVDMYNFGAGNRIISSQIILVENDQFGDSGPLPLDNNLTKIALTPHTPEKDPNVTALTATPTTIQGQWLDTSTSSSTNASWTTYHLEACQNADFSGTCVSTDVAKNSGTAETGTVGGLLPSTTYSVRVKANNILSNVAPMSDSDWLVLGTIKTLPIIQDPGSGFVEFTHFTATVTFHNSSDPVKANPVGTKYVVRIRDSANAVVVSSDTYSVLGTSSELLHVRVKGLTAGTAYTATAQAINPANVPADTGSPNSNEVLIASFTTLALSYTYQYTTIDEHHSVLHMEFPSDFILWRGRGCGYSPAALFGCGTGGVDFTFGPLPNGNRFVDMYNFGAGNRIISSQIILVENDQFGDSGPLPLDNNLTKIALTPHTPEKNPGVPALTASTTTIQAQWLDTSTSSSTNASWTTYRLQACVNADFSGACVNTDVPKNSGTAEVGTLSGLAAGTTYNVRVKANNILSNIAPMSDSDWLILGAIQTSGGTSPAGDLSLVNPASISPNPVTGTTGTLSVLATDGAGGGDITYTWSRISGPALGGFSVNGNNGAKTSVVTFLAVGTYTLRVTITNHSGTITSDVTFQVVPTLTTLKVSPNNVTLRALADQVFTASGFDQFGNPVTASVNWSVNGGGAISSAGVFSAAHLGQQVTVTARQGNVSGTATVNIISFDVSNAFAYPVPFRSTEGNFIHFRNLGSSSHVRIYTPRGRKVQELTVNGDSADWDVRNSDGEKVASGVYLYVVESPEQKKHGKLIVIQ